MDENGKNINLLDIIDIKFLQEFQDFFAKTMGVASITVDKNGPITKPSNFTDFCIKYTRESKEGFKRCNACDIKWGEMAAKSGKPVIYTCHSGLTDFAVPIIVGGEHVASILGGQILTHKPDENQFRALARELGINEDEYIIALNKIKILPIKQVKAAANFLHLVANAISKIGHKNLELIKKNKLEDLYKKIIETIRTSLDINETKQKIVDIVGKVFEADRCFITDYDKTSDKFLPIRYEYLSSEEILPISGTDVNAEIPNFSSAVKNGNSLIINDKKIYIDSDDENFNLEKKAIKKFGVNSAFGFPLYYSNELLGVLSIQYVKNKHKISDYEINLLNNIANQISLAIHQSDLYEQLKQKANIQKTILNNMPYMAWIKDTEGKFITVNKQFGKNYGLDESAFPGKNDYDFSTKENAEKYQKDDLEVVKSGKQKITEERITTEKGLGWAETYKSPFTDDKGNVLGTIGFAKDITETKEAELELLKRQEKIIKAAQREKIIQTIIEKIRSSLDFDETLSFICEETARLFNVQRVAITVFPDPNNYEKFIMKKEYISSQGINKYPKDKSSSKTSAYWGSNLIKEKEALAFNSIEKSNAPNYFKNLYKKMGVKSCMGTAIRKNDDVWGTLVLSEYHNERQWTDEEKLLLETISNQVYIAINQAELFEKAQKTAEKEKSLREIILSTVNTFDIEIVIKSIVTEAGKLFKADRCFFIEIDPKTSSNLPIKNYAEYLSSKDIASHTSRPPSKAETEEFIKQAKKHDINYASDINKEHLPAKTKKMLEDLSVKSYLITHVFHGDKLYGTIVFHYVNNFKQFTQDEIDIALAVANQTAIVFHHAEIFEKEKETAQREKILRETIEILRSTLNAEEIKKYFTQIVCNYFNADRCLFDDFDRELNKFLPFKIEIRKSPDIKSLSEVSVEDEFPEFATRLKNRKNIIIKDLEKTLLRKKLPQYKALETLRKSDTKSDYGLLVEYKKEIMGILILHFVNEKRILTHEEFDFLKILINQAGVALYQSELYKNAKKQAKEEGILRKIIETVRSSMDLQEVKKKITQEIGETFKADRCYFRSFDKIKNKFLAPDIEYLSSPEINSLLNVEPDQEGLQFFMDEVNKNKKGFYPIIFNSETAKGTALEEYMASVDIKADYAIPIIDRRDELIWLVLHYSKEDPKFDEDEKKLLETIAYQIDIAFEQIKLFNVTKKTAEREKLIGNIISKSLSTFDINQIKQIVKDVCITMKADRCYFVEVDLENMKGKPIDYDGEYLASPDIKSIIGYEFSRKDVEAFVKLFLNIKDLFVFDYEKMRDENNEQEQGMIRYSNLFNLKSGVGIPLFFEDKLEAVLTIEYVNEKIIQNEDELNFLRILGNQIAMAFNQIQLYQNTKKIAETEKFNRKILEILRNTLDKNTIISLFVKNIGKYFKADRVFFSDYDPETNMYMPVEEQAEYLSSPKEKSFIGYDWSDSSNAEYIQPLLEKRELKIPCWDEYIKDNPKGQDFISLFEDADVKSSYNFPVIYESRLIGYFCIEFTQDSCIRLSEEDINRIRSMCTQAAIALYHAELFVRAKEASNLKDEFIVKIVNGTKEMLNHIIELSDEMGKTEPLCNRHFEHMHNINEIVRKFLDFVNDIDRPN